MKFAFAMMAALVTALLIQAVETHNKMKSFNDRLENIENAN